MLLVPLFRGNSPSSEKGSSSPTRAAGYNSQHFGVAASSASATVRLIVADSPWKAPSGQALMAFAIHSRGFLNSK